VFNYNERRFRPEGETGPVVTYRQEGDLLWAEMPAGGSVRRGALTGRCGSDGTLDFAYSMVLADGEVVCGGSARSGNVTVRTPPLVSPTWKRSARRRPDPRLC
jgi:hypothetical protein